MLLRAHLVMRSGDKSQGTHYSGHLMSGLIWDMFLHHLFAVNRTSISLEYTLARVRIRNATDPRDKGFAILNIIPRNQWPGKPDYTKNVVDVFTNVAKHIIHKTQKLEILRSCERTKPSLGARTIFEKNSN